MVKKVRKQAEAEMQAIRPEIMAHVRGSIAKNRKLLALLARPTLAKNKRKT